VEPDIDEGQKIQDTYGPIFDNTLMQLDLFDVSLKMLKDTYRLDSQQLSATWKKMVTEQRGEYSQRRKLARLTEESECTFWPTATTSDAEGGHTKSIITEKGFKSHRKNSDQYFGAKLRDAVETVENLIPTPCSRDHKGGKSPEKTHSQIQKGYRAHLGALDNYIAYHNWLNEGESKGTLNPNWVEALMGLPQGWTSLKGDSNQWQNGWHNGLWEKNIPRVAINIDDKVDRLRSLGNGVVPQTAAKAWIILNKKINL
jgi:hypothetical protein